MRVCLLSHYYEPEVGAPQRRWSAFVPHLVAAGHEVTVVTGRPHYPRGRVEAGAPGAGRSTGRHGETVVRVRYVPYDTGRGRRLLDQLVVGAGSLLPVLRARPDVVVATAPGLPTLLVGRVSATLVRARLVVEMRDAWPDLMAEVGVPRPARAVLRPLLTRLQTSADAVVAVSERFAGRLRGRGAQHVVHVANGTDTAAVAALPPPVRPGPVPLRVCYAGTVGESQAVHLAVRAVGLCPPGSVHLTVVGHGAALPQVLAERAALPDPGAVHVLPPTDPAGVRALLLDADTALVTLRAWPSFEATVPSKLYELLALGRHVSAAVAGEAADVLAAAGGGDVVAPEDPAALAALWQRLLADPQRLDVGPGPRRWVHEHADDSVLAERYVRLLADLHPEPDPVPPPVLRSPLLPPVAAATTTAARGRRWVVLGAGGFVGRAVVAAAAAAGAEVVAVTAPRLQAPPDADPATLVRLARDPASALVDALRGADVVVNAAGLATPGAGRSPALTGADALLPVVVAWAAEQAGVGRVVHLSSAAVLGERELLDAGDRLDPRSPYAEAKAAGERALGLLRPELSTTVVVARATSVQGPGRATTRALTRLARSPLATVAGTGDDPVPVTTAEGLGRWVLRLATEPDPPVVSLQPWEGWTTASLLRELGGREPARLPVPLARALVRTGYGVTRLLGGRGRAAVRRVELVWFGQRQADGTGGART